MKFLRDEKLRTTKSSEYIWASKSWLVFLWVNTIFVVFIRTKRWGKEEKKGGMKTPQFHWDFTALISKETSFTLKILQWGWEDSCLGVKMGKKYVTINFCCTQQSFCLRQQMITDLYAVFLFYWLQHYNLRHDIIDMICLFCFKWAQLNMLKLCLPSCGDGHLHKLIAAKNIFILVSWKT